MIKKLFFFSFLLIAGLAFFTKNARADYMYGNGEVTRQIIVDKKLKPVSWSKWYDNLSINDISLEAEKLVEFKILVKNSGEGDLADISVADTLPGSVNYLFGAGEYKKDNHQVEWKIDHLNPGEEKEFKLRVQIIKSEQLPEGGSFPVVNRVKVIANTGETDEDTAQFYIKGRVEQLPEAGINLALGTILALGAAATGFLGRKFGRGEILS